MKKGLQILEMPLMGIKEGAKCGMTKDFVIDAQTKKVSYLILKGNRNEYDFLLLKISDITGIGKDFITTKTIENAQKIGQVGDIVVLLGMKCVSNTGDVIGKIKDFSFDEKTGDIKTLLIDNGVEVSGREIMTISNDVMFLSTDASTEPEESFASSTGSYSSASGLSSYEKEQRDYLLGKTVSADIKDAEGKVLIKKGAVITEEVIVVAEKARMLTDLTLSVE